MALERAAHSAPPLERIPATLARPEPQALPMLAPSLRVYQCLRARSSVGERELALGGVRP
ncbi:MAG: hypothetical protein ACLP1X_14390 [Polyangiaceae bacterium]